MFGNFVNKYLTKLFQSFTIWKHRNRLPAVIIMKTEIKYEASTKLKIIKKEELENIKLTILNEQNELIDVKIKLEKDINGKVDWISIKSKYFTMIL